MRKAINFFRSYYEVAKELNDKDRLAFYDALLNKQFENIEPNLKGMANFAYISQKHSIDTQVKGYYDKTKDEQFNPNESPSVGGKIGGNQPPYLQEKEEDKDKVQEKEEVQVVNKKINIKEFVFLSESELNKLNEEFASHEVEWMLNKLNDYKASTGKKYKSDYAAINMWVKDAFRKAKVDFIKDNNTSEVRISTAMKAIENINWDDYTNQL
jgi:hypothetical protein